MSFLAPKKSKRASWEKDFLKTSWEKFKLDVVGIYPGGTTYFTLKTDIQASVEIKTSKHKRPVDPIVHGEICVHGKIQPKQDAIEKLREQDVERGAAGIMGSFGQI